MVQSGRWAVGETDKGSHQKSARSAREDGEALSGDHRLGPGCRRRNAFVRAPQEVTFARQLLSTRLRQWHKLRESSSPAPRWMNLGSISLGTASSLSCCCSC